MRRASGLELKRPDFGIGERHRAGLAQGAYIAIDAHAVDKLAARRNRLEPGATPALRATPVQQRRANAGFARVGVGSGDENAAWYGLIHG